MARPGFLDLPFYTAADLGVIFGVTARTMRRFLCRYGIVQPSVSHEALMAILHQAKSY